MPSSRRAQATFAGVTGVREESACGVVLQFRPQRSRLDVDSIEDFAPLGPEWCIPAVSGLGKVLRILRAARMITPRDPTILLGQVEIVTALLEKAVGTPVALVLRPRSRVRFTAWTDGGVQTVDHVSEVVEAPDAYLVLRRGGRYPVRIPRDEVIRRQTECERWYEVLEIERVD
jgi:hypothetical protein